MGRPFIGKCLLISIIALLAVDVRRGEASGLLHPGAQGYTWGGPGHKTIVVCRDIAEFHLLMEAMSACTQRETGKVEIEEVYSDQLEGFPVIRIRSAAKGWSGVVEGVVITLVLPVGLHIPMASGADSGDVYSLWKTSDADYNSGIDIGRDATVQILRQLPANGNADFYVRVISGSKKGLVGWMLFDHEFHLW